MPGLTWLGRFKWTIGLCALWLIAVLCGYSMLNQYAFTQAHTLVAPADWKSPLPLHSHTWNLIVVAHPQCPCTRASINELERLMAHGKGHIDARVLFYRPDGSASSWNKTDLWQSAQAIPGVVTIDDPGGRIAASFAATTSGETFLYDATGILHFHGGITESRGHEGDNAGEDAIAAIVEGQPAPIAHSPIYGCSIR